MEDNLEQQRDEGDYATYEGFWTRLLCPSCGTTFEVEGDISCPECEAPEEDLRAASEEDYEKFKEEEKRSAEEMEERRRNPPPEKDWEREGREKREKEQAEWQGPDSLGKAFRDIPAESGKSFSDDGSVGGKFDSYFGEGSSGMSISIDEAKAIAEKIKRLERENKELRKQKRGQQCQH